MAYANAARHMIEDIRKALWATADKLRANMGTAIFRPSSIKASFQSLPSN